MKGVIGDAYDKWTTGFYDYIQVGVLVFTWLCALLIK